MIALTTGVEDIRKDVYAMVQGIGEHMEKECNVSSGRVFVSVTVFFGTKLAQAAGDCRAAHLIILPTRSRWTFQRIRVGLKVATKWELNLSW